MTLNSIFTKPVDRPIEGVIKADDNASLRLEVEEYVLTNEVEQRLEAFLGAYTSAKDVNGAWLSGFFGSGKSHLLKMLALLLENKELDGVPALDIFLTKCGDNEILRGELRRAAAIPSRSILFNIDQKADVISKTQTDALLAVFVKVFDETCGYYGKQGHIAQFERDLDSRGLYASFMAEYESVAGKPWQRGREQALLESTNIAKAYARVSGSEESEAIGILDCYRKDYRVSIEDFAEKVNAYINQQGTDFRLNFFVDEVGQYIADNVKLMTNLQTVAESLATKCKGRSWIVVTSQEDLDSVIGQGGSHSTNDFSKIKARFACETGRSPGRMKLTSKNVDEVIQKRLLSKTELGVAKLQTLYSEQSNNFKTLFGFSDGSREYKNFQDVDHFVASYPFVPYQFALFQSAIQNLSQHNAFEGKHSSVGERSMLGVFQQVAIHIGNHAIGELATFDLMFEGIRTALKANIQRAVLQAENHLNNPFAVRLLKVLFLVKYVNEFKPTLRNLCILMLDGFSKDIPALKKQVEQALNLLEQQTYIQRNGDLFGFLTDEEKDVEQEIKNTEVDASDVANELEKIIFDHVIKHNKIRYTENGQDYPFSKKLDDRLHGKEYELAIHVISPFHENADKEDTLRMQTMGRDELLVILPPDERLVRDLLMYKRTEKYVRQTFSSTQQDAVRRILTDKGFQNQERYAELKTRVKILLSKAQLLVAGADIETGSEDPQTRILKGFYELIARTYPNLRMLRGITYTENDITKCLKYADDGLFGNDAATVPESEQELFAFIQSNSRGGVRTTLKGLLEKFERKPYGWPYAAVLCTLAKICARGKVEVRSDGNLLEESVLERALRNTHGHSNVVLDPQMEFTASQIRALKEFYEDFFDTPPHSNEAKALGKDTAAALVQLIQELRILVAETSQYPFLRALNPVITKLETHQGKPYTWFLTEFSREHDTLLDLKESVVDPIRTFMSGPQKAIYDEARAFMQKQEANFSYIGEEYPNATNEETPDANTPAALGEALNDPTCFKGDRMQQVRNQVVTLQKMIGSQLEREISNAKNSIDLLKDRLCGMDEFGMLSESQKKELLHPFDQFRTQIADQTLIAVIRDTRRRFEESEYQRLLSRMTTWAQTTPEHEPIPDQPANTQADDLGSSANRPSQTIAPIQYVPSRSLRVTFDKAWLADESDVERYLNSMRDALLDEIRKGKRIQI
ncbi:MAG: Brex phage defense system ATPase BrxC [Bacteroidetes bacterium HLUCCA01]|nr:MAG: Brex phage defense system ATPase BrxC [Bacteroidetes bacterium HLUCCA01]